METLEQTVSEHALQISLISNTLTDMKDSMKDIAKAMKSQEILLEKLSNIEAAHEESKKRLYRVIEKMEDRIAELEKTVDSTCPIVDSNMANMSKRIEGLEASRNWAVKGIVGSVMVALLGIVIGVKD